MKSMHEERRLKQKCPKNWRTGSVMFLIGANKKILISYDKQKIYFSILQTLIKQMQLSKAAQNRLSRYNARILLSDKCN